MLKKNAAVLYNLIYSVTPFLKVSVWVHCLLPHTHTHTHKMIQFATAKKFDGSNTSS